MKGKFNSLKAGFYMPGFHQKKKKIKQLSLIMSTMITRNKVSGKDRISWTCAHMCHLKQITFSYCLEV